MDFTHQFGPRQVQDFGAVFLPPVITLHLQIEKLDARPHPAITQQDLITKGVKEMGTSGHGYPDLSYAQKMLPRRERGRMEDELQTVSQTYRSTPTYSLTPACLSSSGMRE
ncbi:hypothetical protein AA0243_1438 [Novacetimonas hansenii NRIC 0243]|nr:hypothetical protein AA0243_1438 [Novacetimonas hansenii NRIC 0243]